ncbi:hypothetical protein SARC_08209 [Sphaeroforma arctica JP610]|uniref:Uncharacterized protein n=1 Tax=Sphaeroforma arctica JP610 TaxID=667725 RepID=A0A0L0FRE5_9EUKA|nr:hypothetical protein SARC_08209 [Sphaeroforma arctica JP610]KNC79397.1 hypothetical protein SARC_08209 [Sphaeroforma arctica JP610]|eukprot:XP_014153299.1 hypothetical protein SARC_08209 [Sphaeroforma arctica JP610]
MQSCRNLRFGLMVRSLGSTVQKRAIIKQASSIKNCTCILSTSRDALYNDWTQISNRRWYSTSSGDDELSKLNLSKDKQKVLDKFTGKKKSNFEAEVISGEQLQSSTSSPTSESESESIPLLSVDDVIDYVEQQTPEFQLYLDGAHYEGDRKSVTSILNFLKKQQLLAVGEVTSGSESGFEEIAWTPVTIKENVRANNKNFVKFLVTEGYEGDPKDLKSVTEFFRRSNLMESTVDDQDVFTESYVRQLIEEKNKDLTDFLSKKGYKGQIRHSNRVVEFMRSKQLIVPSDDEHEEPNASDIAISEEQAKKQADYLISTNELLDYMGDPDFKAYLKEELDFEGDVESFDEVAEFLDQEHGALVMSTSIGEVEEAQYEPESDPENPILGGIDPKTFFEDKHDMWKDEFPAVCLICRAVGDHMTFDCPAPTLQDYLKKDHRDIDSDHSLPTVLDAADLTRRTRSSRYINEPPSGVYMGGVPKRAPYKMYLDTAEESNAESETDSEWEKMTSPDYFVGDDKGNNSSSDYTVSESEDDSIEIGEQDFEYLSSSDSDSGSVKSSKKVTKEESAADVTAAAEATATVTDTPEPVQADAYAENQEDVAQQAASEQLESSVQLEGDSGADSEDANGVAPGAGPGSRNAKDAKDERGWGAEVPVSTDDDAYSAWEESMDEKEARNRLQFATMQRDEFIKYFNWLEQGGDVTQIINPSVKRHYLKSLRMTGEVPMRKKPTANIDERKRAMAASFDL